LTVFKILRIAVCNNIRLLKFLETLWCEGLYITNLMLVPLAYCRLTLPQMLWRLDSRD